MKKGTKKKKDEKVEQKHEMLTIVYPSKGICSPAFAHALRTLEIPKEFKKYEVLYISGADVAIARNNLAEAARGEYIFWVDDDVLPPPDTIKKLYAHDKDIVSGLYFSRQPPHYPQIHMFDDKDCRFASSVVDYERNALIEIDACGAGCMLIKRKVFDKIKKPYFNYVPATETEPKMGEDYYFCKKVKEAGMKVYCDTSVICKHIGEMFIGPQYWEINRAKLHQIESQLGPEQFEKYKKQVGKLQEQRNDINR